MMRDLSPTTWQAQPWKNGGGVTHEIVRWPDVDDYDVRVSVAFTRPHELGATADAAADVVIRRLSPIGDLVVIDGELAVDANLSAGPTRLLNILVRRTLPVPVHCGLTVPERPVRFAFALDDGGELPRGHARVFDPPGQIDQRVIWIE